MQMGDIEIRAFAAEHLASAVRLSQEAGWPHRPEDWLVAQQLSEGVVAVEENGNVVGTALVTPYGSDCATINMVIVDSAMRGRGLGRRLMDAALAIGGARPLRLIATSDGLPLYEKLGFGQTGAILQHQGIVASARSSANTQAVTADDLPAITALDRQAFGADRTSLMRKLFEIGEFAVIRNDSEITGFACIRVFGRGEVIGPVVTGNLEDAQSLVSHFLAQRIGSFVRVDTIAAAGLAPWLSEHALSHVGGGIAMSRPHSIQSAASTATTFALANQALG
ncbi:GNAT family N-acetyltransferase [Aliirhizobium cellulosilyticum]|uniref:Putative N-acetyltransferase YhbS n=1 Tax=Aliirhizobium cellulosilyticum TaxID=393664 RepID=A0A7W6SBL3_9HYPH|nr:GNAT family N-acetyltransferase [Rhizobium cellulosilyticum]MBB4350774.1 putative N-acetyltransferase YhbS [Rhizobium cellulosilyticum]MBB4413968.1 putative N-acetyltransferase YhbS [Rhizobium cellulosilyticum]MBB4448583.1 putative N-acetyltransferase YhbS [Rhizobium cellulosilyticum]